MKGISIYRMQIFVGRTDKVDVQTIVGRGEYNISDARVIENNDMQSSA